jgi:O-antigen ligase
VAQLLAKVGAGVNLDKAVIGPLTMGQGGVGGINVFGQATGVQGGSFVSLGVFRVNALALDPNHLGIMLAVPILVLLPFALRFGIRDRRGFALAVVIAFCSLVEVLTLSRSGFLAVAVGLLVLAVLLRRQLLSPWLVIPVVAGVLLVGAIASQSHYVRTIIKTRVTVSDRSAQVHYQIFALVPPVLDEHPLLGLGLNTFSVYYEFQTGRTDWGPHSYYVALIAETGLIGTTVFGLFLIWLFLRLAVLKRAAGALARAGDPEAARAGPLADGLLAALVGTMAANVFYLTMQFYYFYALVLVLVAAAELYAPAAARARATAAVPVRERGIAPA